MRLEAYDFYTSTVLAKKNVTRKQFGSPFAYQDFPLPFTTDGKDSLELRVFWTDIAHVRVDWVSLQP